MAAQNVLGAHILLHWNVTSFNGSSFDTLNKSQNEIGQVAVENHGVPLSRIVSVYGTVTNNVSFWMVFPPFLSSRRMQSDPTAFGAV